MIARLWQASTRRDDFDAYWAFLQRRALPDYQAAAGNEGVQLFRRLGADRAHFMALSFWPSQQAIRCFAGGLDAAKYYPENINYLVDAPAAVAHYEAGAASAPAPQQERLCSRCQCAEHIAVATQLAEQVLAAQSRRAADIAAVA